MLTSSIVLNFEQQVVERKAAPAVSSDGKIWSYEKLNDLADDLAFQLLSEGIRQGDRVGIDAKRSRWFIVGILAILKIGGVYVPIDTKLPEEQKKFIISGTNFKLFLCHKTKESADQVQSVKKLYLDSVTAANKKAVIPVLTSSPDDPAYIMYTSGSSGEPKGVEVLNKGVVRLVKHVTYVTLGRGERHLQLAPNIFDASTFEIWAPLLNGGCCVIYPQEDFTFERLEQVIVEDKISLLWLTASLFNAVIDQNPAALSPIKQLLIGGEALSVPHVKKALALLPDTEIINGYGPTEATTFACSYNITKNGLRNTDSIPIGSPIDNTYIKILDEDGNQVPEGIVGELCIGGAGVASRYINDPNLTEERFIIDRFQVNSEIRTIYRTGDKVRMLPDQNIEFIGRFDDQIKIRGHRIEPGEIEVVLKRNFEFTDSAVVPFKSLSGDTALAAFISPSSNKAPIYEAAVVRELKKYLPNYMIPMRIVEVAQFPITTNGKLDRKALIEKLDFNTRSIRKKIDPPQTSTEITVARIWQSVLEIPVLNASEGFFHLGGNSLQAMKMIAQVKSLFSKDISLGILYEKSSLLEFCSLLDELPLSLNLNPKFAPPVSDKFIASFGQLQIWLAHFSGKSKSAYNVSVKIEIGGSIDRNKLEKALEDTIQRHETLRARFHHDGRELYCKIDDKQLSYSYVDVINTETESITEEVKSKVFSLEKKDPLVAIYIYQITPNRTILLLNMHHILVDEWSINIILADLKNYYISYLENRQPTLNPSENYQIFCTWQRQQIGSQKFVHQKQYWKKKLADVTPFLGLPQIGNSGQKPLYAKGQIEFAVPEETTNRLMKNAASKGITLFSLLMAIYGAALSKFGGKNCITVGTPVSLRDQPDFQNTVGYFLNTIAIKMEVNQKTLFSDFLHQLNHTISEALANKDVPFQQLVEELEPRRDEEGLPYFQTLFSMQQLFNNYFSLPDCHSNVTLLETAGNKMNISLQITASPNGLEGCIEYNQNVYDERLISEIVSYFQALVKLSEQNFEFTLASPAPRHADLKQLSPAIKSQLTSKETALQTDLEIALTRCWGKTLKLENVDPGANFFDLGGNSILALQLISEIKKTTGLELKLAALFEDQSLQNIIRRYTSIEQKAGDLVVSLNEGVDGETPIFCIHGVFYYRDLARTIDASIPVYSLLAKEHQTTIDLLNAGENPQIDIFAMVDTYSRLITDIQPAGPYRILGHSFGGILAYEIARKLESNQEVVENLILVDTLLPDSFHPHWYQKVIRLKYHLLGGNWPEISNRLWQKIHNALSLKVSGGLPRSMRMDTFNKPDLAKLTNKTYQEAMHKYRPQKSPLSGSIVLIRASETLFINAKKPDFGWTEILGRSVDTIDITGNHLDIVLSPNVGRLGKLLQIFLEKNTADDRV